MTDNALVSILFLSYNQEDWIGEGVQSVLDQDYENLEIIISDDCSTDSTYYKIHKMVENYEGGHEVVLLRNDQNLGIGLHVQKLLSLASGELIVMCAGDDVSMSNRVSAIYQAWIRNDKPHAISSSLVVIDSKGLEIDHSRNKRFFFNENKFLASKILMADHFDPDTNIRFLGATLCYTRELVGLFGGFQRRVNNEDLVLLGRAILMGGVLQISDPLVLHRVTGKNVSANIENDIKFKPSRSNSWFETELFLAKRFDKIKESAISRNELYCQQLIDLNKAYSEGLLEAADFNFLAPKITTKLEDGERFVLFLDNSIIRCFLMFLTGMIKFNVFKRLLSTKPNFLLLFYFKFFRRVG